ncbi:MAG: hypothetical protein CSA72_10575 [Rhodobacterales bacterium]|nr:MAG: hypothetical protein CSA72_10575 [Rhodobacterales bacterium]
MTMKLTGLDGVLSGMDELTVATRKNVARRVLKKGGQVFADRANDLAPEGPTGQLKGSYTVGTKLNRSQRRSSHKPSPDVVRVYAGTNDPAGQQQEFGNINHDAQPHARPAWDQTKGEVLDTILDGLRLEVGKAAARARRKAAR